jgi:hypothetical protein
VDRYGTESNCRNVTLAAELLVVCTGYDERDLVDVTCARCGDAGSRPPFRPGTELVLHLPRGGFQ